jgi:hypothetical protein
MAQTQGFISNLPDNYNILSPIGYRLNIQKLPNVVYFCQTVNIPDLTLGEVTRPTPLRDISVFGDNLTIGTLDVGFVVDEDMTNYLEIQTWMRQLSSPSDFSAYSTLRDEGSGLPETGGQYSDATLHILTNSMNINKNVQFKDLWPTSLGAIDFNVGETEVSPIIVSVSFNITDFTIVSTT